jgi:hypothetical protein
VFRFFAILTVGVAGIATAYAGSLGINPGDVLNPDGTVSIGLLPSKGGTGLNSNPDGITGSGMLFQQRNYFNSTVVLSGRQTTPAPAASTNCSSNCQQVIYSPPDAPTFNLLGDNVYADRGSNMNFWLSQSTGTGDGQATINIPVGIFGVNSVMTLLNTAGGAMGGGTLGNPNAYASITFTFNATDAAGTTGTNVTETLLLINGLTQRNVMDGWCGFAACPATVASTISNYTVTDGGNTYLVQTGNEWTGTVNDSSPGVGTPPPIGTTMVLDYQIFPVFTQFQNDYLVSVSITDTGAASGANYSRELLSGLTVGTSSGGQSEGSLAIAPTPEPSTLLMFVAGFSAIGLSRLRRKRN